MRLTIASRACSDRDRGRRWDLLGYKTVRHSSNHGVVAVELPYLASRVIRSVPCVLLAAGNYADLLFQFISTHPERRPNDRDGSE